MWRFLFQPALLVHFALVFPERRGWIWPKLAITYAIPTALLTLHIFIASGTLDFLPAVSTRYWLDKVELGNLGIYFLIAAGIFLVSYRRAPSGDSAAAAEVGHGRHFRRDDSRSCFSTSFPTSSAWFLRHG